LPQPSTPISQQANSSGHLALKGFKGKQGQLFPLTSAQKRAHRSHTYAVEINIFGIAIFSWTWSARPVWVEHVNDVENGLGTGHLIGHQRHLIKSIYNV